MPVFRTSVMKNLSCLKGRDISKTFQILKSQTSSSTRIMCVNKPWANQNFHVTLNVAQCPKAFFGMGIPRTSIISSHPSRENVLTRSEAGWSGRPTGSPGSTCSHSSLSTLQGRFASHATAVAINHSGFITVNSFTFSSVHVLALSYTQSLKEIQRVYRNVRDEIGACGIRRTFWCQSHLICKPVLTFLWWGSSKRSHINECKLSFSKRFKFS